MKQMTQQDWAEFNKTVGGGIAVTPQTEHEYSMVCITEDMTGVKRISSKELTNELLKERGFFGKLSYRFYWLWQKTKERYRKWSYNRTHKSFTVNKKDLC